MRMPEKWAYKGDWVTSCNCDYGCPCNFNARPTPGHCEGIVGVRIESGTYGGTKLNGVKAVAAAWWPGAIHEGKGIAQWYFDEKMTPMQLSAMTDIVTGAAGGLPWGVFARTFTTVLPPRSVAVTFKGRGEDTQIRAAGHIEVEAEPIRNPVTNVESHYEIFIKSFLIFQRGHLYSNKVHTVKEPNHEKLSWNHTKKYFALAKVAHKGP